MLKGNLLHVMRKLYTGQSLARILMDKTLAMESVAGIVVDIGGGRNPDYYSYFEKVGKIDLKVFDGSLTPINFEVDTLPLPDNIADTAVLCNILEHLYNYELILSEVGRILKPSGKVIGFVPFWVGYHPDPHDYFRYTQEALERMFDDAGFIDVTVTPVGGGPLLANFNTIVLSLPRIFRPVAYVWYAFFDFLFIAIRPQSKTRNPLGFKFVAYKHV